MRIFSNIVAVGLLLVGGLHAESPRGEYAELHSCEVYTGGCTASAQMTQGGRTLLRVWRFDSGEIEGVEVGGLPVVVLEAAEENLAVRGAMAKSTVAYFPENTSDAQRKTLASWLAANDVKISSSRTVPISYHREGAVLTLSVGKGIEFSTRAIEPCDAGSCGEQLWYEPRGKTGTYTVFVNERSRIEEPALRLSLKDHSSKSVFFGCFGVAEPAKFTLAAIP